MSLILLVLTTSTTCVDIDLTMMRINNNTSNVIFIYPADDFRTYPPTTLPTENNFYGYAKVIEPYDNKSIAIDYFHDDLVTVIVIEQNVLRKHTWEEIRESQLYTVLQCTVEEASSGYVMEYNGSLSMRNEISAGCKVSLCRGATYAIEENTGSSTKKDLHFFEKYENLEEWNFSKNPY